MVGLQLSQVESCHAAACRQVAINPQEAAVGDLQQLCVPAGDLKFEANLQLFPTPLLPVAADAEQFLATQGNLMSHSRGDAGAAFELAGGSCEQFVARRNSGWCFDCN